jgi:hypothetical protein
MIQHPLPMTSLEELFCHIDDFCQSFEPRWQETLLGNGLKRRQRSIIETIIDQFKNISQIEHSRHRSPINFLVNVVCGLIAYCHQPKKPSLHLEWALPPAA